MTLSHLLLSILFEAHCYGATAHLPYDQWLEVNDNLSQVGQYLTRLESGPVSYHNPK